MSTKQPAKAATPTPTAEAEAAVAGAGEEWGALDTIELEVDPKALKRQETNARFMTAQQMEQFVANLRRDKKLTSLPLCYRAPGSEDIEILSGHHRVEASILAELNPIRVIVIVSYLSEARKTAIQLSHNAIVGQDDPATLAMMYSGLDLDAKAYSGLDDTVLKAMENVELTGLNVGVKYQEMNLFFLEEDEAEITEALQAIEKAARKEQAYVARFVDFDHFFETIVLVKTKYQAFNSGIAFRLMADLARERLAQIEAEQAQAGEATGG
jgi:hypothetical protein